MSTAVTKLLITIAFSAPAMLAAQSADTAKPNQIGSASAAGIRFTPKLLTVDSNEGIDIVDVNRDGKLDIVSGRNWFAAPDFVARPLRILKDWNGYVESNGEHAFDVDQDGWPDVITGSYLPTKVHWYRNPGQEGLEFGQLWEERLLVDTKLSENETTFLRDLNGDGRPEWITNSWQGKNPVVAWQFSLSKRAVEQGSERTGESTADEPVAVKVTEHRIGQAGNTHGMGFGDINNDGREDILIATGWYERPEGNVLNQVWKFHADWEYLHSSCPMLVRDLDGDGINDLVWGRGHDYGLYWWRGLGEQNGKLAFEQKEIDAQYSQIHTLHFADLDGDGTDELITGKRVRAHNGGDPGGRERPCMYYYRWDLTSNSFQRFPIEEGHVGTGLQIRTADLNGDGKLDIAVSGKDGTWILFQE